MEYLILIGYLALLAVALFLGGYNFIFNERTKIAEKKLGIKIPKIIIGLLHATILISITAAFIFAVVLIVSIFFPAK